MKHKNLKSDEAYEYVKERRPTISPNFNFLGQLYEYEKMQQNAESLCRNKTETPLAESLKPVYSHSTSVGGGSTNNSLPFLKFSKKQHSAMNLFETTSSSPSSSITTCTTNSPTATTTTTTSGTIAEAASAVNTSVSGHVESVKYSPPKSQRKKQFIFQFNNNTADTNVNENILSPQQQQQQQQPQPQVTSKPSLLLNQIVGQSSFYGNLLPSPSQAFSNINLNSPSTNMANKTIMTAFESNNANLRPSAEYHQSSGTSLSGASHMSNNSMPKSFTVNDLNDINGDRVVMRRPTNLFNEKLANVKNLKRPSSILLETNNNIAANEIKSASEFASLNYVMKPMSACLSPSVTVAGNRSQLFYSAANSNSMMEANQSASTVNNSSCSASSSCSSSASSASSASSSTLMSSLINNSNCNCSSMCTINSNNCNNCNNASTQQTSQKKIKLSPIQDRNVLNNFTQTTTHESNYGVAASALVNSSTSSNSSSSKATQTKCSQHCASNEGETSFFKRNLELREDQTAQTAAASSSSSSFSSSAISSVLFRSKLNFNLMLNPSTNTQEHYMSTSKMNESKSMDTIKSALDSPGSQQLQQHSHLCRNSSFELTDEATAATNAHSKYNEDFLFISNSLGSHSSVSTATLSNSNNNNNNVHMQKSSSNSSSKNGSNKNSLHGSIETMIEVS